MTSQRCNFGLRFQVGGLKRLPYVEQEVVLHVSNEVVIVLRATYVGNAIEDSNSLALFGSAFGTDEDALSAGDSWRSRLERSFSVLGMGRTLEPISDLVPGSGAVGADAGTDWSRRAPRHARPHDLSERRHADLQPSERARDRACS